MVPAAGATRTGKGFFQTPQRVLAACLLASIAVHVLLFLGFSGWSREAAEAPAPVLDVVLVAAPQAEPAVPEPVAPAAAPRRSASPAAVPTPTAIPAVVPAPATAEPAAAVVAVAETPRLAAEPSRAAAPAAEAAVTPPLFSAAYLRNPAPAYPALARRSGEQGTVMLKVLVSPEGAPLRVELDQSSGSRPLDNAAQDAVKNWRFVPARRGAQNIEAWVRVPVVFKLES